MDLLMEFLFLVAVIPDVTYGVNWGFSIKCVKQFCSLSGSSTFQICAFLRADWVSDLVTITLIIVYGDQSFSSWFHFECLCVNIWFHIYDQYCFIFFCFGTKLSLVSILSSSISLRILYNIFWSFSNSLEVSFIALPVSIINI